MIRIRSLFCNPWSIGSPDNSLYTFSEFPDLSFRHCPSCGARGQFVPHGRYCRWVIDLDGNAPVIRSVSILRVRCSCGHTHALLKDILIPYCQYTIRFILCVLRNYFSKSATVDGICRKFQIAPPTLYRWKKLFLAHRELWLGLLRSGREDPLCFLQSLDRQSCISDFLADFFHLAAFSFLQSHADPAQSRRLPEVPPPASCHSRAC